MSTGLEKLLILPYNYTVSRPMPKYGEVPKRLKGLVC